MPDSNSNLEHTGRTALVSGATGGLGLAQCEALAREGADVLMLDKKDGGKAEELNALLPASSGKARFVECDLSQPQATKSLALKLADEAGGIDILINNVGVNPTAAIDGYDLADWQRVMDINATSAVALSMACVPEMKRKGSGQIINICSVVLNGGWSNFTQYVSSKGTLLGLTRSLARELGPFGIRANAISPGPLPTPLEQDVWGEKIEAYTEYLLERQSLKFRGNAADVAQAMLFLVSQRARFITGQNLSVDGGWWMR